MHHPVVINDIYLSIILEWLIFRPWSFCKAGSTSWKEGPANLRNIIESLWHRVKGGYKNLKNDL